MADNATKSSEYEPTTSEIKLLEVLCNPESVGMNITEICCMADIDNATYYRAMKKEGFRQLIKQTSLELVKGKLSQIVNATIKFAVSNSKCSADRKTLLQMADMITEKTENKNTNDNTNRIVITGEVEEWAK